MISFLSAEEIPIQFFQEHSGWILPCGKYFPCEAWWHIHGIYELYENHYFKNFSEVDHPLFKSCDEERLRKYVANKGLIKVGRGQIDIGHVFDSQIFTLHQLIRWTDVNSFVEIYDETSGLLKKITVNELLLLDCAKDLLAFVHKVEL